MTKLQHLQHHAEWKKNYRTTKRESGICAECTNKALAGKVRCLKHLKLNREYIVKLREQLRK